MATQEPYWNMTTQEPYWKQLDPAYAPSVIVTEKGHYVGTANGETSAKLIIRDHNALVMRFSVRVVMENMRNERRLEKKTRSVGKV